MDCIRFTYKDTDYKLYFTRKTVIEFEATGLSLNDIDDKPATIIYGLFKCSFLAEHKFVNVNLIDEIYDNIGDKAGLFSALLDLYRKPLMAMTDEDQTEKKIVWTTG